MQNNIYGVDIAGPAVEIGKLRLWLSVIGEVMSEDVEGLSTGELALPNIAFNLRQGNSLIGYTGFPEVTDDGDTTLHTYEEETVRSRYEEIITEIHAYEEMGWQSEPEEAEKHRQRAFDLLEDAREELVDDMHQEFVKAGIDDITAEEVDAFD
ncbi:MAG: Eco57I restriction-modification methylase domain-containing protein, partial [Halobacteriota archaeon]